MIDSLWALGRRLKLEGVETPFLRLKQTIRYKSLVEAKEEVAEVGRLILKKGLPPRLVPFVCGFLGYGHVSQGAQEIFDLLPSRHGIAQGPRRASSEDGAARPAGSTRSFSRKRTWSGPSAPGGVFDLQDYYRHPAEVCPDRRRLCPVPDPAHQRHLLDAEVPQVHHQAIPREALRGGRPAPAQGHRRHHLRHRRLGGMHGPGHGLRESGLRL